ncbi:acyltransferase family protein [Parvibaculum lavamentivorans]|nr:acyltransferase family protein [Parvibaculum lavamentivorans]
MKYRPEIDGLRALAILPVVLFHAGFSQLSGGYTGVDVFFVISGYLITRIIVGEAEAGTFSILHFYRRRILRIVPVLAVVLIVTAIIGYYLFLPNEFDELSKSLIAVSLFSSNIFFWQSSGYFDAPSALRPLLHTWSLAVEEQFYLFFPFFIIAIHRFGGRRYGAWIFAAVVLSFAASAVGVVTSPSATFYLLPTRAWELGVGALIAVGWVPRVSSQRLRHFLAAAGIIVIGLGLFLLDEESYFPGWNALYPVLGTALVIAYGQGTFIGGVLSTPPVKYVGLVSYAWYLWHWPVIVYYTFVFGPLADWWSTAFVIVVSFLLAAVSRPLVEQPFRYGLGSLPTGRVVMSGAAALAVLAFAGWSMAAMGQVGRTFPPDVLKVAQYSAYRDLPAYEYQFRPGVCMLGLVHEGRPIDKKECLTPDPAKPDFLVLGDSHAGHIWRALSLEIDEWHFLQATASGCMPFVGATGALRCTSTMRYIFEDFLQEQDIDGVIIAARWEEDELDQLDETLAFLKQHVEQVIVLGPVPEYESSVPLLLARSLYHDSPRIVSSAVDWSRVEVGKQVAAIAERNGVTYISMIDIICPAGKCVSMIGGKVPVEFDYGHLTLEGARFAANRIEAQLGLAEGKPRR